MSSVFQTIHGKQGLPLWSSTSLSEPAGQGIRRRFSFKIRLQPMTSSPAASWAFRRSKSVSSMGEYAGKTVRNWWERGWAWIVSRKPSFAKDVEMNEEEAAALGCESKGSWKHVFYKVKSEIRRKLMCNDNMSLPQTKGYSTNFDVNPCKKSITQLS